ncbi:hypothetical protein WMF18_19820 [Sorangium sp. So ce315]|uniref:hypothetical protein n=1 Tax=Sorangium sp. So ce315 TaxID=3133299 RepID=UPI003F5F6CF4
MKIERLFNVLIVSGAAVGLAACSDDSSGSGAPGTTGATSGSASSSGQGGGSEGTSSGGGEGDGGTAAGNGGAMAGSGGATAGSGGAGASAGSGGGGGTGGASSLDCSEQAAVPDDPCGCPCCWVTGCLNTEPCCAAFCEAGNDGEGCCGG